MKRTLLALAVLAVCSLALGQRKPDVQVIEIKARRVDEGKIVVDGRVRSASEKPIKGLSLVLDFESADGDPLTTLQAQVEDDVLDPGKESSFHAVSENPPGAIRFKLRAMDATTKPLRLSTSGPFTVE